MKLTASKSLNDLLPCLPDFFWNLVNSSLYMEYDGTEVLYTHQSRHGGSSPELSSKTDLDGDIYRHVKGKLGDNHKL